MKKALRILIDIIELYIPAALLIVIFLSFIVGIFCRYVLGEPMPWTYELSTIAFVSFTMLSACYVQRNDEHINFDMFYQIQSDKMKCIMRIISDLIVAITSGVLIPKSVEYVSSMNGLTSPIIHIPRTIVFFCFIIMFADICIRSIVFFFLDARSFMQKRYSKDYPRN